MTHKDAIDMAQADIEDAYIAWQEHRAYNECEQFDGDICDQCVEHDRDWDRLGAVLYAAQQADRRSAIYNRTYARAIRTLRTPVSENLLLTAHEFARAHTTEVMGGGRTCGKCAGSGVWSQKTERTAIDGSTVAATCFACAGKGRQTDADRIRNDVYWAKYARVSA